MESVSLEDLRSLTLIWKVKLTQMKMMEDRGYLLTDVDLKLRENSGTLEEFWDYLQKELKENESKTAFWDYLSQIYTSKKDSGIRNIVVFLPKTQGKAFPTMKLNKVVSQVKRDPTLRCLDVIYEFPITKLVRTKLALANRFVCEWSYADLVMPVTASVYMAASFKVLKPDEFDKEYKNDPIGSRAGLPALCKDDPLVKYFQWPIDTVIRSIEYGDVNVAVTRLIKDYVVSTNTIQATIDVVE